MNREKKLPTLDIIIPVFNVEEVLEQLFCEVEEVFSTDNLSKNRIGSVRLLFIDDGSTDRSAEVIASRVRQGFPASLYRFTRNFGHRGAVTDGLDHADADLVCIMDADLQDPPGFVFEMIKQWREGYDVVHAVRTQRQEHFLKVLGYKGFYRIMRLLADVDVPIDSGDFCLMDFKVVRAIRRLPERMKFPRFLRCWVGYEQTVLQYRRRARVGGKSKYSLKMLYSLATSGFLSSGTRLLKVAQVICISFFCLALALFFASSYALVAGIPLNQLTILILATWSFFSFCTGVLALIVVILGAYVGRIYIEVQARPPYLIMENVTGEDQSSEGDKLVQSSDVHCST